jgi:NADPH:quinone reductase-like Zn-dependent oxidoreductase
MKTKSVVVTLRGGPEVLEVLEHELSPPSKNEVRIRVLASHVSLPDVQARYGHSPFKLKPPFTPGYAVVGRVEALGSGVSKVALGDTVGVLTVYGGYTEYLNWKTKELIPVSTDLDPGEAVCLILNYLVAYQTMHRTVGVKPGDVALIIGASGGIGTALLQLGNLAGLKMYGLASPSKHHVLQEYGAIPIDYHTQRFEEVIHQMEPEGIDVVFDGMGGDYFKRGFSVLRRGGTLVGYGNPLSLVQTFKLLFQVAFYSILPNGRSARYYGTGQSRFNREPFLEDWAKLLQLLEIGQIIPIIHRRFPILEARQANEMLESGQVIGNLVLVTPEML